MINFTELDKDKIETIKSYFPIGKEISGKVIKHRPFGVFINLENDLVTGLLRITDMGFSIPVDPSYFPKVGEMVICTVLDYGFENSQIVLESQFGKFS